MEGTVQGEGAPIQINQHSLDYGTEYALSAVIIVHCRFQQVGSIVGNKRLGNKRQRHGTAASTQHTYRLPHTVKEVSVVVNA